MLARWAGYLALAGGALLLVLVVIVAFDPASPAWWAFFAVVVLLGAAALGLWQHVRAATGQLGMWAAWLSAIGAVGLLVVFAYAVATNQMNYDPAAVEAADGSSYPLAPLWMVTAGAWFVGNLGFAVALIRARLFSPIGGWLVAAGALVGLAVTAVLGANVPPAAMLLFALFGVGWMVIGYGALRPALEAAT